VPTREGYNPSDPGSDTEEISMRHLLRGFLLVASVVLVSLTQAADRATVSPLTPSDARQLEHQRQIIKDMAALHLGRSFTGEKERDLDTLQQLLDQRVVESDEISNLQAMGVVLGDLLAHELDMQWIIYEDEEGRSRALQLGPTQNFLFPITMISRRVEVGIKLNVADVYAKAVAEMEPFVGTRYRKQQEMP